MNTALNQVRAAHHWRALLTYLAIVPFLAACSTAGSAPRTEHASPTTLPPVHSGPVLAGTVNAAEDVTLTASFRVSIPILANQEPTPAPSDFGCAQYAAGVQGSFVAPAFDVTGGDHTIHLVGMMSTSYPGPGVYQSSTKPSLGGTIVVGTGVDPGQQASYSVFRSHINGTSTLTVHDDGSGIFVFSEWGSDEVQGNTGSAAGISGTVTWTCH